VPDGDDRCANVAGLAAFAGCPDSDGDGVQDADDSCPTVAGRVELAGCPPPDRDGDSVPDEVDACPDHAGLPAFRGCGDRDHDGVIDDIDACPDQAEVFNGIKDEDGCPDVGISLVTITRERLEIAEKVFFDTGSARIQERSHKLLREVAAVLRAHPEIVRLRVDGHTDSQGNDAANLKLSKARADAVRTFLIEHDVVASRLEARGFGEAAPLASNQTGSGRETNRRVELNIVDVPETVAPEPGPTP
jgi:OOP family OmpA-OmpF porin